MVQKVVYNTCHGGYGVAEEAVKWMRQQDADEWPEAVADAESAILNGEYFPDGSGPRHSVNSCRYIDRTNPLLVAMIEGDVDYDGPIDGYFASLDVASVPDGKEWTIDKYDGKETVRPAGTFS